MINSHPLKKEPCLWFLIKYAYVKNCCMNIAYIYMVTWLVWFYGISTFVGYLMPNPFLHK